MAMGSCGTAVGADARTDGIFLMNLYKVTTLAWGWTNIDYATAVDTIEAVNKVVRHRRDVYKEDHADVSSVELLSTQPIL